MKKRYLLFSFITLIAVAVVGCANVPNSPTATPEQTQNNQQDNQQQNNGTNDPITTPAPQGNQAPAGLAAEPYEMFTYEFMNVEQLYRRFGHEYADGSGLLRAGVEFDQSGIVITAYHGELLQVRIPDTIEGFPVVAIGRNAFPLAVIQNEVVTVMPVTNVFFPPTVRVFEFGAIEVIGQAPRNTPDNLPNSITVPHGVTHLVHQSRSGVNRDVFAAIRNIELPNTLLDIPSQMFENLTSMTGITIPNSVERIGERAFEGATSLLRINFLENISVDINNCEMKEPNLEMESGGGGEGKETKKI
ncbi:MAG: leucine-rich repeat domain-containing protein [Defluviitaleaceae bacterium]|nr:leucine-rich repeat domain-containing protein [Defluviitaleaceae bacterium]